MQSVADVSGRPASRRQHVHTDTAPFIQLGFSEISGRYAAQFVARHTGNIWPLLQPHAHTHRHTHSLKQIHNRRDFLQNKQSCLNVLHPGSRRRSPIQFECFKLSTSLWSEGDKKRRQGSKERREGERHSSLTPVELREGRAYQLWFLIAKKGRSTPSKQGCKVNSFFILIFLIFSVRQKSCLLFVIYTVVIYDSYKFDSCVNRNVASEGFALAVVFPLCSSCVCRYHTCVFVLALWGAQWYRHTPLNVQHPVLCLIHRWSKGQQHFIGNVSSSLWWVSGFDHWDPRSAYSD